MHVGSTNSVYTSITDNGEAEEKTVHEHNIILYIIMYYHVRLVILHGC